MADFVQVMKDWRRLCETIQSENQQKSPNGWCIGCPIQGNCVIDSEIKYTTDNVLAMIGERIQSWAAENPEPVYPSWSDFLNHIGLPTYGDLNSPIRPDIAKMLGLEPKEE